MSRWLSAGLAFSFALCGCAAQETTYYTRYLLRSVNADMARDRLGVSALVATNTIWGSNVIGPIPLASLPPGVLTNNYVPTATLKGHVAIGSNAVVNADYAGTSASRVQHVMENSSTYPSGAYPSIIGSSAELQLTHTTTNTDAYISGTIGLVGIPTTNTAQYGSVFGGSLSVSHGGSGPIAKAVGGGLFAATWGSADVEILRGAEIESSSDDTSDVRYAEGAAVTVSQFGSGVITNVWAVDIDIIDSGAGSIQNAWGLRVHDISDDAVNAVAIKTDGTAKSDFGGKVHTSGGFVVDGSLTNRSLDMTAGTNVYDDVVFEPTALNPVGLADAATLVSNSGQSSDQLALMFQANRVMYVAAQLGHTWVAGTTVYPHLHIEPQSNLAITNTWRVSYSVADIGQDFPASTVVTNTVTIPAGSQWSHVLLNVPTNGISMAGKTGPSTIIRLFYTLLSTTENTHVVSFDVHYRWGGSPVIFNP